MAGIFDMFKQTPAPAVSAAAASANANPTVPNAGNSPTAVADPAKQVAASSEPASPLEEYKDLWQNDPNAPKPAEPFKFNSDPAKLMETAKTVDFKKIVSPELMSKITAGGADAQGALMEAMNNMSQMTFAQSSHASAKIVEAALQAQEARFKEMLPSIIKQYSSEDNLRSTNPLMNDPAMAPMVQALQQQFTNKYPTATVDQIKEHVNDYLNGAADKIVGLRPAPKDTSKRASTDWNMFLETGG